MGTDSGPFPSGTCSAVRIRPLSIEVSLCRRIMAHRAHRRTGRKHTDRRFLSPFQALTITRGLQQHGLHPSLIVYLVRDALLEYGGSGRKSFDEAKDRGELETSFR